MMTVSAMRALARAEDDTPVQDPIAALSTDYLNRYGEALMLLEMAPVDPEIVVDLQAWRAVGYREHFEGSQLRCTTAALTAYDGLAADRRKAFETLCTSMNRLIATVTGVLSELPEGGDPSPVVEVASEVLRVQIGRATHFINANGTIDLDTVESAAFQDEIDALFS